MGVSLRTLAKLTNPAMARWWKRRGMWLLGAGIGCTVGITAFQLLCLVAPNYVLMNLGANWPTNAALAARYLGMCCFMVCALNVAGVSVTACRNIETENAIPACIVPSGMSFTLALLRTWPAFIGSTVLILTPWVVLWLNMLPHHSFTSTLAFLLQSVCFNMEAACAMWLVVLWLTAFKAAYTDQPWLDWVWVCGLYLAPGALRLASELVAPGQSILGFTHEYFTRLDKNMYLLECAVTGVCLAALAVWLRQRWRWGLASGLCLVLAAAALLNNASGNIPAFLLNGRPHALRYALACFAQIAEGMLRLPFHTDNTGDVFDLHLVLRSIYPMLYVKLPPWLSFLSLLLNLIWLAAMYLFISRVLLREPRKRDKAS